MLFDAIRLLGNVLFTWTLEPAELGRPLAEPADRSLELLDRQGYPCITPETPAVAVLCPLGPRAPVAVVLSNGRLVYRELERGGTKGEYEAQLEGGERVGTRVWMDGWMGEWVDGCVDVYTVSPRPPIQRPADRPPLHTIRPPQVTGAVWEVVGGGLEDGATTTSGELQVRIFCVLGSFVRILGKGEGRM